MTGHFQPRPEPEVGRSDARHRLLHRLDRLCSALLAFHVIAVASAIASFCLDAPDAAAHFVLAAVGCGATTIAVSLFAARLERGQ